MVLGLPAFRAMLAPTAQGARSTRLSTRTRGAGIDEGQITILRGRQRVGELSRPKRLLAAIAKDEMHGVRLRSLHRRDQVGIEPEL